MPTIVTCKEEHEGLEYGKAYEVLAAKAWGYLIRVGRKTSWYPKGCFIG